MKPALTRAALLAAALLTAAPATAATPDPATVQAMTSAQFLVGRWNCAHTVGDFSGIYTTSFANALEGRWLRQRYDFPATANERAWYGEFYLGFDARVPRWVRFGAMSTGQYFGMVSKDGSVATMVFDYRLPGGSATATWTKKSDVEFSIDGPSYPDSGKLVTEHHTCKKAA